MTLITPGVVVGRSSTTTNSGYLVGANTNQFILGGGETFECIFQMTVLTDSTLYVGFIDSGSATESADGAYIQIASTGIATGKTAAASSRTSTGTTYTISAATWYRVKIVVNTAATQVDFYIYNMAGTLLWTNNTTATIPTGATNYTGAGIACTNVGTTAQDLFSLDYMAVSYGKDLVR